MHKSNCFSYQIFPTLDSNEDWNFSEISKKRLYFALFVRNATDFDIPEDKFEILKQKFGPPYAAPPIDVESIIRDCASEMKKMLTLGVYGSASDILQTCNLGSMVTWSINGIFRKFSFKTRLWDHREIIQGMKIELDDGSVQAFGMDTNDHRDVVDLIVPKGTIHILHHHFWGIHKLC